MNRLVTICDGCRKKVIYNWHGDSVDMIRVNGELLWLGDRLWGESSRPSLPSANEREKTFCPDCFLKWVIKWVEELKRRPPSKIAAADIIYPARNE